MPCFVDANPVSGRIPQGGLAAQPSLVDRVHFELQPSFLEHTDGFSHVVRLEVHDDVGFRRMSLPKHESAKPPAYLRHRQVFDFDDFQG